MAPALTEPLSEKLSNSTAKATPSTRSRKRSSESTLLTTSSSSTISGRSSSLSLGREKRSRNSLPSTTPTPSTSARVTRSKDAFQRVFEEAVTPASISSSNPKETDNTADTIAESTSQSLATRSIQKISVTTDVLGLKGNESMGLATAICNNNNKNNRNNNKTIENIEIQVNAGANDSQVLTKSTNLTNIASTSGKSGSTEQLLADLTDDFEEAITADICLRKQLREKNLTKGETSDTNFVPSTGETQTRDILGINPGSSVAGTQSPIQVQLQHMESLQQLCGQDEDGLISELQTQSHDILAITEQSFSENSKQPPSDNTANKRLSSETKIITVGSNRQVQQNETDDAVVGSHAISTENLRSTATPPQVSHFSQKHDSSRIQILAIEELPALSTESTMTASEVDDNLEERLSQLDGTTIASSVSDEANNASAICAIPTTPPRTPTKHNNQQLHQQTTPSMLSQVFQHNLTPQGGNSSLNTASNAHTPPVFMKESGAGDLEDQDIEEVLKALKGLDGTGGADTLCDLNVLFNEVYTLNYEEMSHQPTTTLTKPNPLNSEIERGQQLIERKLDILLHRLRKLHAFYMCKHTTEEIAGLFEWSARVVAGKITIDSHRDSDTRQIMSPFHDHINILAARPPASSWIEDKKNPVPSSQMVALLRRLEAASNAQQLCTTSGIANIVPANSHIRKTKKALLEMQASTSRAATSPSFSRDGDHKGETVVGTFDVKTAEEITHVAGLLQSAMREMQNALDSDATESSSGGESADEMVTYNNQLQQPLAIAKRAAWRYSRDRAAVASRWAWLLSQIADLEIKIRQHGELYQEIVRTKGPVSCGLEEQLLSSVVKSNVSTSSVSSSVNGYKSSMSVTVGSAEFKNESGTVEIDLPGSCRTRGYVPSQFRKRKLFQTTNIHTISKKAARTSTLKCGCQWPLQPCALCTGRTDPTAPRDPPDTMMKADRVALLDPGYHPVLSFPEDISQALHLEAIARMPDWQQRVMRCQVKSIARSVWKAEREATAAHSSKKYGEPIVKRRYIRRKGIEDKNVTVNATNTSTTSMAAGVISASARTTEEASGADQAASLATASNEGGNGTGILSTSTTPLVANKLTKNAKKLHYHQVADGVLVERPLSPVATNHSGQNQSSHQSNNYIHQTSDHPQQNYDPCNPNPAHSSLISSSNSNGIGTGGGKNNHKYNNYKRKSSLTTGASNAYNNQSSNYSYNNINSPYYNNVNSSSNSELNILNTNDNWDVLGVRSRTSSPTHGGTSSNYHKYERSKNRTSYDIDNIVIPYSVAAATRVEILPYKEIPTPKWRVIELAERERALNNASAELKKESNIVTGTAPNVDEMKNSVETNGPSTNVGQAEPSGLTTVVASADAVQEAVASENIVENEGSNVEKAKRNNVLRNNIIKEEKAPPIQKMQRSIEQTDRQITEQVAKKLKLDCNNPVAKEINSATNGSNGTEPPIKVAKKVDKASAAQLRNSRPLILAKPRAPRPVRRATVDAEDTLQEDISDEAITQRHERALAEERRKFQTYLKFPWSTRSRANRRIDSRAESSGANTPDPSSPAPHTPSLGGNDQESIPSPLAPSTPLNPLDAIHDIAESSTTVGSTTNHLSKNLERRRTTSTKKERELERRSSTPDPKELVPPYEPLNFPLTDEALDSLLKAMPVEFHIHDDSKYLEDCNSIAVTKYTRNRSNWRSDSTVRRGPGKSASTQNYCDGYNKRQRLNNNTTNNRRGGSRQQRTSNYVRGKDIKDNCDEGVQDEAENDDVFMLGLDDDDDYDYPKHHLAPDDDLFENATNGEKTRVVNGTDEYGAYVGRHRGILGITGSEGESSDTEPFADDDPNDPEWRGEPTERGEKLRKSIR